MDFFYTTDWDDLDSFDESTFEPLRIRRKPLLPCRASRNRARTRVQTPRSRQIRRQISRKNSGKHHRRQRRFI